MSIHASRFSGRGQPTHHHSSTHRSPSFRGKVLRWLLILVIVAALAQGLRLALTLAATLPNIPNQPAYSSGPKTYDRTNLLLVSFDDPTLQYLAVLSLTDGDNPKLLKIDPAILVNLPGGRGAYRLRDIPGLAKLDNLSSINLLRDALTRTLAIPIDGYLDSDTSSWNQIEAEFGATPEAILNDLGSPQFLWQVASLRPWSVGLRGSLAGGKLLGLALGVRDQSQILNLVLDGSLVSGTTPLGEAAQVVDSSAFDQNLGTAFQERSIVRVRPRVTVINSSGIAGAGATLTRMIRNLGGEVISTDSGSEVDRSTIVDHLGGSNLSGRVAPLIGAAVTADHTGSRADIEIVIGKNASTIF